MKTASTLLILLAFSLATHGATPEKPVPAGAASTGELAQQLAKHLDQPRFHTAIWGVKVIRSDTGEPVFEHNADQYFSPASNSKLFTTALALDRLGPDYRIKTSLLAAARPDASGKLAGDLIVYGRGDPTLNARLRGGTIESALEPFVKAIQAAGIKRIDGQLLGDESFFRGPPYGGGWAIDDLQSYYGAEISALTFNDNTAEISVKPGLQAGQPAKLSLSIATPLIVLSNRVTTIAKGGARSIDLYRPLGENVVYVSGKIPLEDSFKDDITLHRPARIFLELLRDALARRGIVVGGSTRLLDWKDREVSPLTMDKLVETGSIESLPMKDILREIMKPSQNLYTDLLLAHVGELSRTRMDDRKTSEDLGWLS